MAGNRFHRDDDDVHREMFHHHSVGRLCGAACAACCSCLVFLIILLGIATLIVYLVLRPRTTHYNIVTASVTVLQVNGNTSSLTTTSTVDADITYGLQADNPNKHVRMEYQKFNLQTTYLGIDIGHTSIGGFTLGHHSTTIVSAETVGSQLQVNGIVASGLQADINRQSVTVHVRIDTKARAHIGSYTSFWIWLHSDCTLVISPPEGGVAGSLISTNCHTHR